MPGFFHFVQDLLRAKREEELTEERVEEAREFEEHLRREEEPEPDLDPEPQIKAVFPEPEPEPKPKVQPDVTPTPVPQPRRRLWAGMEPPAPYPTEREEE